MRQQKKQRIRSRRLLALFFVLVLLLLSAGVALYPLVSNDLAERYQSRVCTEYTEQVAGLDDSTMADAWRLAREYNASLLPVQPADQTIPEDYDTLLNVTGSGIMGYVEIPSLNIKQSIFHGTDAEVLNRGIGHLRESSLPVGGTGSHCVLTGHSGVAANRLFSDIDKMEVGDVFYLHVLDQVLAYEVTEIHTVLPSDTTRLAIDPDRDRCTLITCTPFGVNTHRLLVQGDRIEYNEQTVQTPDITSSHKPGSTWAAKYYAGLAAGGAVVLAVGLLSGIILAIRSAVRKRKAHEKTK